MKKGISTWLFTKVVMLVFLTLMFGIILSFTSLVQQRSIAESAQQITIRTKDSIQALLGIRAESGSREVVLPTEIPRDTARSTRYTVHIFTTQDINEEIISIAIARGEYDEHEGIPAGNYIAASSFRLPQGYGASGSPWDKYFPSSEYSKLIITRTGQEFNIEGG